MDPIGREPLTKTPSTVDPTRARRLVRALVMCDLVDSTAMVERLGDQQASQLMRQHDRMARGVMRQHGGAELDRTDGFLTIFETPAEAVHFALDYQRQLRVFAQEYGQPLQARAGIHFGDVVVWDNARDDVQHGARRSEVDGLALSIVARLAALALPGQILVTDVAEAIARRARIEFDPAIRWLLHGRYVLKGVPHDVAVHEVGEHAVSPLRAPPPSAKAWPYRPLWRRRAFLTGGGLATAGGLYVLFLTWTTGKASPLILNDRDWVVVGDLVNINGDSAFDAALSTAFRIGIAESRFVNVLPDASVRQALARMKRDPDTRIDRGVGVEIALRERARAVILPSLVQSGVRVRLAAEVVDPDGARTVWTQTVDAEKTNDLLPAMDRLLRQARQNLGESLQQIQGASQPLEQVTTPNLEALRTLTSAYAMERDGRLDQAERLLRHAVELDPGFATAYRGLGVVHFQQERYRECRAALEKALSIDGRLTERERLFTRALLAEFTHPVTALKEWRAFAVLYPDNGAGQHNVGRIAYTSLNDLPAAAKALAGAAVPRNPLLNHSLQMRAQVLLGLEELTEAETQMRAALAFADAPLLYGWADLRAAQSRFDEATQYLRETGRTSSDDDAERWMRLATLLVMQEKLPEAAAALDTALAAASRSASPNARWRARSAMVSLHWVRQDAPSAREDLRSLLRELSAKAAGEDHPLIAEHLLYSAAWAARLGLVSEAVDAIALVRRGGSLEQFPVRSRLAEVAQAEIDLRNGHAPAALARTASIDGTELWESHDVRARAMRAKQDRAGEIDELRWLAAHPGRALAQWLDQLLGQQARMLVLGHAKRRIALLVPR